MASRSDGPRFHVEGDRQRHEIIGLLAEILKELKATGKTPPEPPIPITRRTTARSGRTKGPNAQS